MDAWVDFATQSTSNWTYTEEQQTVAFINNIAYYSMLFPVALLGNIVSLATVIKVLKAKKSKHTLLIGILALADLMSLLTCHLLSIASMIKGSWIANDRWCHFQSMMSFTYFKLQFFTKTIMSLDRFVALAFPLHYHSVLTMKKILLIVGLCTATSLISSGLTLVFVPEYVKLLKTWPLCIDSWGTSTTYHLAVIIIEGTIFCIGSILCFVGNVFIVRMILLLNKKRKEIVGHNWPASTTGSINQEETHFTKTKHQNKPRIGKIVANPSSGYDNSGKVRLEEAMRLTRVKASTAAISNTEGSSQGPCDSVEQGSVLDIPVHQAVSLATLPEVTQFMKKTRTNSMAKRCRQREVQVAKFVLVGMAVFVMLWIPYMAVIYYEQSRRETVHPLIEDIAIKLVFANAFINPVQYGLFLVHFRNAYLYYIKTLWFYVSCKKTKKPSLNGMPWKL